MELVRKSIPYYDVILDNVSVYEESTDAIVPDAFPDIARIVYADGTVSIKDESPQNDRVLVSGSVAATVLYQPEVGGSLQSLEIPLSFAHIEEARGVSADCTCFVRCSIADVTARAVNSRKVSVSAKLCFETTVYQPSILQYTEQIQGGDTPLEVLYDTKEITLLRQVEGSSFTILDDLEWNGSEGLELLHTDCALRQNECRAMNGRMLIRGEAVLQLLLRDDTGVFQQVTKNIPFTQMLDASDMQEGDAATVRLAVRNLDCILTGSGVLSIGIGVCAVILQDEKHAIQTIHDLYQTKHALNVQVTPVKVQDCMLCGSFAADGSENIPLGMKTSQYLGAKAICMGMQMEGDTLRVKVDAFILYYDDEGNLYQTHRALHVPLRVSNLPVEPALHDIALQVALSPAGEDSVNVHLSASGGATKRTPQTFQDVTSVELGPERNAELCGVTLILRRVEEGESLWDIAKQYATTVSAIRSANSIAEEQKTTQAQLLLIPMEQ